jgi:hypothetical protein
MTRLQSHSAYHKVREEVKALFRLPAAKIGPRLNPGRKYNVVSENGKVLLRNCLAITAQAVVAHYNLDASPAGVGKARAVAL